MTLERIEEEVEVNKIKHHGVSVWPVLKTYLIGITGEFNIIKEATSSNVILLLRQLVPDLFSIRNLKKNAFWVFTNSERRYYINQSSFDRVTTGLLHYLDGYVLFENPIPKGRTSKDKLQKGERRIGMSWIFLCQFLLLKFIRTPQLKNLDLLESYLQKDLSRLRQIYKRILAGEKVYGWLIRIFKPRAIFVVCYYSNFEIIRAAKKHNIPVLELQHGMVSEGHRAYFFRDKQNTIFFPDYFLSYGRYSSKIVVRGNVFRSENILNYGNSFLEEVNKNLIISAKLEKLKHQFQKTICITGQMLITDVPLLEILTKVCERFPNIGFLFKPRFDIPDKQYLVQPNLILVEDINTYELLKYCDFHLTVYSTCAMESLFLGTPNIAIDINGFYAKFLKKMLDGNPYNFVVKSERELENLLVDLSLRNFNKNEVKESIDFVFSKMAPSKTFHDFFQKIVKQKSQHQ